MSLARTQPEDSEERWRLCDQALTEVNQILDNDKYDASALLLKSQILALDGRKTHKVQSML